MVDNDQIFSHGIKHDPCYDCILVVICQQVMFADMPPVFRWVISTCCTKFRYGIKLFLTLAYRCFSLRLFLSRVLFRPENKI